MRFICLRDINSWYEGRFTSSHFPLQRLISCLWVCHYKLPIWALITLVLFQEEIVTNNSHIGEQHHSTWKHWQCRQFTRRWHPKISANDTRTGKLWWMLRTEDRNPESEPVPAVPWSDVVISDTSAYITDLSRFQIPRWCYDGGLERVRTRLCWALRSTLVFFLLLIAI